MTIGIMESQELRKTRVMLHESIRSSRPSIRRSSRVSSDALNLNEQPDEPERAHHDVAALIERLGESEIARIEAEAAKAVAETARREAEEELAMFRSDCAIMKREVRLCLCPFA